MLDIHIIWDGPFNHDESLNIRGETDYGLYQFYGDHIVYGQNVLLYLGRADSQTFGRRISQHNWNVWASNPVQIHLGRIASESPLDREEWIRQIRLAEKILLQSHTPAFNSSGLNNIGYSDSDVRLLNWGMRKSILPEVSISRWEGGCGVGNKMKDRFKVQSRS